MPELDVDRFRKCVSLMRSGATAGECAAGEAAATRVAAAAGLSLEEALRHRGGLGRAREAPRREPRQPAPKAKMRKGPVTLAELLVERERQDAWRKKRAAREERRLRAIYEQQEAANAILREEQARRDLEWVEARARAAAL